MTAHTAIRTSIPGASSDHWKEGSTTTVRGSAELLGRFSGGITTHDLSSLPVNRHEASSTT